MTTATGNFAELLWPGIKEIFGHTYKDYPRLYTKIFEEKKSTMRFEKVQSVTGLPLAAVKEEGNAVTFVDPSQGYQKEFVNVTYALGATVTREMFEDDQYDYINRLPKMLARSMVQTEETLHFNVLNNGFSGGGELTADGVSVFNTSHPLVAGGNFRNQLNTNSDLSETSLEQACIDIMDWVDDQSLKIRVMPKTLVVPTALNFIAKKILNTGTTPFSADLTTNEVSGMIKDLVVSPWLTDSDAWFLTTDQDNGLISFLRRKESVDRDNEFATQNLQFLVTKRWSQGAADPRGVFGTPGA